MVQGTQWPLFNYYWETQRRRTGNLDDRMRLNDIICWKKEIHMTSVTARGVWIVHPATEKMRKDAYICEKWTQLL